MDMCLKNMKSTSSTLLEDMAVSMSSFVCIIEDVLVVKAA